MYDICYKTIKLRNHKKVQNDRLFMTSLNNVYYNIFIPKRHLYFVYQISNIGFKIFRHGVIFLHKY